MMTSSGSGAPRFHRWELPPLHVAAPVLALAVASTWFTAWTIAEMVLTDSSADWSVIQYAAAHAGQPALYANFGVSTYPWSPLMAWVWIPISAIGLTAWRALHVVAALAMPTPLLRIVLLLSWPFWADFSLGNFLTFAFLAGALAWRGSRVATAAYLALTLMAPRPVMIPLVLWIIWRRPEWRRPFAALVAVSLLGALATGLADEWLHVLVSQREVMTQWIFNVAPSHWIGDWWLLIGLPAAALLLIRGRPELAGLAASPYWWPYYLMFGLLELADDRKPSRELSP